MGQAKNRGSFEQRKAEAMERNSEQKRLDEWLWKNRPGRRYKSRRLSALGLSSAMALNSPIYLTAGGYCIPNKYK